jgi:hypothetical protein
VSVCYKLENGRLPDSVRREVESQDVSLAGITTYPHESMISSRVIELLPAVLHTDALPCVASRG